jgi:capsular polysaccharide biosynthesis protein
VRLLYVIDSLGPGGDALGRLGQSARRHRWLLAMAVLVGLLLGYGWAARQPKVYESVSRVRMTYRCPDLCADPFPEGAPQQYLSSAVLQRAVKLSGSRISAETLRQRLEVEIVQRAHESHGMPWVAIRIIRIGVVEATAKGAAQLANAVSLASQQVVAEQRDAWARRALADLARRQRQLRDQLDALDQRLAAEPGNRRLRADRDAKARELNVSARQREHVRHIATTSGMEVRQEQTALPGELVYPKPLGTTAIGGLLGLVVGAALAWWRSRPGTLTMTAA